MPEGDTVATAASRIRPMLVGQRIEEAISRWPARIADLPGREVRAVRTRGKHLLIDLDGDLVLHVHLGMTGSVRTARGVRGEVGEISLALRTDRGWAICRKAPTMERLDRREEARHPVLGRLGPDLLGETVDLDAIVARARARGGPLGDVILDQSVAAGLGNVYKSELPFVFRLPPMVDVGEVAPDVLRALYAKGAAWLRENVGRRRRTVPFAPGRPELWVYGRARRPCLRCGRPIRSAMRGEPARITCWCPACQSGRGAVS